MGNTSSCPVVDQKAAISGCDDCPVVDQKAAISGCDDCIVDFGFAFNNNSFSDWTLRIEIIAGDDEVASNCDSILTEDASSILRVKTLHISSAILAARSSYFYKLFLNGMMESEQRHVTMRINSSDEDAFMELLHFIYNNTLASKTSPLLLDVLRIADKFEVTSCMTHCCRALRNLPMTLKSALLYLSLPSSLLMADAFKQLTDETKQFLDVRYKNIFKYEDELMDLPLVEIEAILSKDDLHVNSEDDIYDFALKWTRANYQEPEKQREILSTRLGPNIRFPYMSFQKLRMILTSNDFDLEFATESVLDALLFKTESHDHHHNSRFVERSYKYRLPIKIIEFEQPQLQKHYTVYLNLKRQECANLFPSGVIYSQAFDMGEQRFSLCATCYTDKQSSIQSFAFGLSMIEYASATFDVEYEYSVRSKPTEKYVSKHNGNHTLTKGTCLGYGHFLGIPWSSFMAEDCVYFINGALHLRGEFTIKR